MMQQDTSLFDTQTYLNNRKRGQKFGPDGDFLRVEILDRIQDRLLDINRNFENVLYIDLNHIAQQDNMQLGQQQYDLIVSNLQMHHVNDPVGFMVQINNALKPDGLFVASIFSGKTAALELRSYRSPFKRTARLPVRTYEYLSIPLEWNPKKLQMVSKWILKMIAV